MSTPTRSFLEILSICDNYTLGQGEEQIVKLTLSSERESPVVGLLLPDAVTALRHEIDSTQAGSSCAWEYHSSKDDSSSKICFSKDINTPTLRSAVLKELCERWRDAGLFPSQIGAKKWRNELYAVYRNPFGQRGLDSPNFVFEVERAASAIFGFITYGVHMTVYCQKDMAIWVPTRARTKQT